MNLFSSVVDCLLEQLDALAPNDDPIHQIRYSNEMREFIVSDER